MPLAELWTKNIQKCRIEKRSFVLSGKLVDVKSASVNLQKELDDICKGRKCGVSNRNCEGRDPSIWKKKFRSNSSSPVVTDKCINRTMLSKQKVDVWCLSSRKKVESYYSAFWSLVHVGLVTIFTWRLLLEYATFLRLMAAVVLPTSPTENQNQRSLKLTERVSLNPSTFSLISPQQPQTPDNHTWPRAL